MDKLSRRQFLKSSAFTATTIAISTSLSACINNPDKQTLSKVSFNHGVASGDPSSHSVILWTRAQPKEQSDFAQVQWQLAKDPEFKQILRSGVVRTKQNQDFTVKVDVQELSSATHYYYRFMGTDSYSQTGHTLTLPQGNVEQVKLVVVSCSNYPAGYFNAYHDAAQLADVDAVLHLGDYIYEYPMGGYATGKAHEIGRALAADNAKELLNIEDYRKRYALYRTDKGLQALHAAAPFIVVWDDHEVCNDTYKDGAQNHNEGEGDFFVRRAAAIQAYYEWLPIRPPYGEQKPEIYRSFEFGNLLNLYMLDTRLIGRDKQLSYQEYRNADTREIDLKGFLNDLNNTHRTLLGKTQMAWLENAISQSTSQWNMLGQQVLMAKMLIPSEVFAGGELAQTSQRIAVLTSLKEKLAAGVSLSVEEQQRLASVMPYNLDAWDGYPTEREAVYNLFKTHNKPLVVVAGDTHNAWYSQLKDNAGHVIGVEFATPGITSPGMETYLNLDDSNALKVATDLTALIDELEYCNLHQRGYLVVTLTPQQANAQWRFVDNILTEDYGIADTYQVNYPA
ncbi:alkaline phosphatase D family protein [Paraglaciecola sp.]|uniref:alkaline phosphatase D family protein n=1 Tax=Paraglaciecola sp. TaxID=1920173 RepID=UPI0030F3E11D